MTDDFSELENGAACYVLINSTTIYAYKNGTRSSYNQVGGKWYKTAAQSYTNIPSNTVCWNYADITTLNSRAEYFPIYAFIALVMAIFVWYFVFRLISRLIKWKI